MSDGGTIVFGALFLVMGGACLVLRKQFLAFYRSLPRSREWINVLSAYVLPAAFVAAGLAMIVGGLIGVIRSN
jgi:hypothetical protein